MRIHPGLFKVCLLAVFLGLGPPQAGVAIGGEKGLFFSKQGFHALAQPSDAGQVAAQPQPGYSPPSSLPVSVRVYPEPWDKLFRFLAGGILGTFIWHYIFGYPASSWGEGAWPLGLLDLLAIAALGYLGYRLLKPAWEKEEAPPATADHAFLRPQTIQPVDLTINENAVPGLEQITAADPDFNLAAFGEFARRLIGDFYTAWNRQDMEPLKELVTEDMHHLISVAFKVLKMRDEISRLEYLLLMSMEVTAAGVDDQKEFITLGLQGRVLDYILQRHSMKLLSGSLTYQTELKEYWRFERKRGEKTWRLGNIEEL